MPNLGAKTCAEMLSAGENCVLFEKISADLITPVSAYLKLRDLYPQSVLYESVEKAAGRGRYSIIACDPDKIWRCENGGSTLSSYDASGKMIGMSVCDEAVQSLRDFHNLCKADIPAPLPSAASGLFGYFSYDMVRFFEKLPEAKPDNLNIPDAIMWRPRTVLVFDSVYDSLYLVHTIYADAVKKSEEAYQNAKQHFEHIWSVLRQPTQIDFMSVAQEETSDILKPVAHITQQEYEDAVKKSIEYIYSGDAFQIVPSQRFHLSFEHDPLQLYRHLRRVNPSPYMFHGAFDDFALVGASPEILVRAQDGTVTIRPIAGTRPRGKTEIEDQNYEKDLLADPKEQSEHLMLLDLGRNDVGRVSEIGTVNVTEEFIIERYSHVMHIVSNVEGRLKEGYDFLDAIFSALPVGTVSGAPKVRAMEIINELEAEKRSFYAGGIGYFSADGNGDFALMLRTALVKDQKVYIQAGAGVVADSVPYNEYVETVNKAGALVKAVSLCK